MGKGVRARGGGGLFGQDKWRTKLNLRRTMRFAQIIAARCLSEEASVGRHSPNNRRVAWDGFHTDPESPADFSERGPPQGDDERVSRPEPVALKRYTAPGHCVIFAQKAGLNF
ncbi:hypothetical protein AVEN_205497-1 [Araneus ventricosus]|uniref:Uncharacterized protein n=1 Tax=Araneus ventricosus TaxID=182803 RepID=A0A4Y2LAV5_ARAVE|nr:hypothetical protein AVEN_205497-1 [Araneus ventricosus]